MACMRAGGPYLSNLTRVCLCMLLLVEPCLYSEFQ